MSSTQFYLFLTLFISVHGFPRNVIETALQGVKDFESSGSDADEPVRGTVKVVKMTPDFLQQSGLFKRTMALRDAPNPRSPLPAFLALGRPGPAPSKKGTLPSTSLRFAQSNMGVEVKRKQGLEMWQRAMDKGSQGKEVLALPVHLKDTSKQNCGALPFVQRVTAPGCETVTVQNKLCFGQCSSLYIPPGGESVGMVPGVGYRASPCSRCSPSRSRSITVLLHCGRAGVQERRVLLVEECKCETSLEDDYIEKMATPHLKQI